MIGLILGNYVLQKLGSPHASWTIFVQIFRLNNMPPVALAAFSFKVVILLLIHCLLLVQLAVFCVNNHLAEEEIDGHFTLILTWPSFLCVFLMVPWVGMQFVILAFSSYTQLLEKYIFPMQSIS